MTARAPSQRLSATDLYILLDWLRDHFRDGTDELYVSRQLGKTRSTFAHLPPWAWDRAQPAIRELEWARVYEARDWKRCLALLRRIVGEWDRSRPPLLTCDSCGLEVRGRRRLQQHLELVHDLEPEPL